MLRLRKKFFVTVFLSIFLIQFNLFAETKKGNEVFERWNKESVEGTMLGWFANAMMAMSDHLYHTKIDKLEAKLKIAVNSLEFYDKWNSSLNSSNMSIVAKEALKQITDPIKGEEILKGSE